MLQFNIIINLKNIKTIFTLGIFIISTNLNISLFIISCASNSLVICTLLELSVQISRTLSALMNIRAYASNALQ